MEEGKVGKHYYLLGNVLIRGIHFRGKSEIYIR